MTIGPKAFLRGCPGGRQPPRVFPKYYRQPYQLHQVKELHQLNEVHRVNEVNQLNEVYQLNEGNQGENA